MGGGGSAEKTLKESGQEERGGLDFRTSLVPTLICDFGPVSELSGHQCPK